jgi:hypothetical protein
MEESLCFVRGQAHVSPGEPACGDVSSSVFHRLTTRYLGVWLVGGVVFILLRSVCIS